MKKYYRHALAIVAVNFSVAAPFAIANEQALPSKQIIMLEEITSESSDETTSTLINLSENVPFDTVKVESHGSFIQVLLPEVTVISPGSFVDGNSPHFPKIAMLQLTPKLASLRIFVTQDSESLVKALKTDILANRILLTLDHAAIEKKEIKEDPVVAAAPATSDQVEPGSANAETSQLSTSELAPTTAEDVSQPASSLVLRNDQDLKDKMMAATIFCLVMLLGLLALYVLKPKLRQRFSGDKIPAPTISTLAMHALAPKQKLALVDIGGEQILLGLTPDSVNFITAIKPRQEPARVIPPQPQIMGASQAAKPTPRSAPPASKTLTAQRQIGATTGTPKPIMTSSADSKASTAERLAAAQPAASVSLSSNYAGSKSAKSDSHNAVDDVRKLIREKLKNLPDMG